MDRFAHLRTYGKEDKEQIKRRIEAGAVTTGAYFEQWLEYREARGLACIRDDKARLRTHVIPRIGEIPLVQLRPHHVRDMLRALLLQPSPKGGTLAPRTIRHAYFVTCQALHDAVVDELVPANPVQVRKSEVPPKRDKDPTWRSGAVCTREEVEQLISDSRIPEDRRVGYALEFLTGARPGEVSALRWRHHDPKVQPLGKLKVEVAYNSRLRREKGTKTERPREVPVHPTLAKVLASWKLAGWRREQGRAPRPDDLIIAAVEGGCRNVGWALKLWHEDLELLGFRERRHYDTRRTFISLALGDGARKDLLRWITHAPGDVFDAYTSPPWPSLCEEVAKLRVGLLEGKVLQLDAKETGEKLEDSEQAAHKAQ